VTSGCPHLSKVCLGTAQLGLPYGIANRTGKPGPDESRAIVQAALEGGITAFDTAPAYGDSETVLGRLLGEAASRVVVVSKIPALDGPWDEAAVAARLRTGVRASLRNLGLSHLPILLFHRFSDVLEGGGVALREAARLREEGLVSAVGASVYAPDEAEACLDYPGLEAVQAPFNLADARLPGRDFFRRARALGRTVFARSVFLQGLFLMDGPPAHLREFAPFRERLNALRTRAGLSWQELALRYALSFDGLASVIVGVETAAQLHDDLAVAARGPLPAALRDEILALGSAPESIIDPRRWKQGATS
jgi:aryl-alcohol dehydrogenase-like predicted oxidoreductase